jgi:hypothetical protein
MNLVILSMIRHHQNSFELIHFGCLDFTGFVLFIKSLSMQISCTTEQFLGLGVSKTKLLSIPSDILLISHV